MYNWEIKGDLQKDLDKLEKKNKALFEQVAKKIIQIAENPDLGNPWEMSFAAREGRTLAEALF